VTIIIIIIQIWSSNQSWTPDPGRIRLGGGPYSQRAFISGILLLTPASLSDYGCLF